MLCITQNVNDFFSQEEMHDMVMGGMDGAKLPASINRIPAPGIGSMPYQRVPESTVIRVSTCKCMDFIHSHVNVPLYVECTVMGSNECVTCIWLQGTMTGISEMELCMDANSGTDHAGVLRCEAAVKLKQPGSFLASSVGKDPCPANDYKSDWFLMVHPNTFPNLTGGCPKGLSTTAWARALVNRYPREQNAQNLPFLHDVFNVTQRHLTNFHSRLQISLSDAQLEAIKNMTTAQVTATVTLLQKGLRGAQFKAAMDAAAPGVQALVTAMKTAGGRILGSPQSFLSLRSEVMSMWTTLNGFSIAINLNPSELNAPLALTLAGRTFSVGSDGAPAEGSVDSASRWVTMCSNPVAAATYFQLFITAFSEVFMGWSLKEKKQVNPNCMFGVVTGFYFKYESTGRGSSHAHGSAIQPALAGRRLLKLFENESTTQQIFSFMEAFSSSCLPCPTSSPSLSLEVITNTQHAQLRPDMVIAPLKKGDVRPNTRIIPLPATPITNSAVRDSLSLFIGSCVMAVNIHRHTTTCTKGGYQGGDADCRMVYPRPISLQPSVDPDTHCINLARHHMLMVAWCGTMYLAQPCNHTFTFMADQSRAMALHRRWREKV